MLWSCVVGTITSVTKINRSITSGNLKQALKLKLERNMFILVEHCCSFCGCHYKTISLKIIFLIIIFLKI
jgi:hypothetical protein